MGIRVLSLFDGMGCGRIALEELGVKVDTYFASEVDKNAIAMETLNFPDTVCLGDVTKVDARKLGHINLLIGGSPCFTKGHKVLTENGEKNIEDIVIGDMVLTHTGSYMPVIDVGSKFSDDLYEMVLADGTTYHVTGNHPFYATTDGKEFSWVACSELTPEHGILHMDRTTITQFKGRERIPGDTVYNMTVDVDHSYSVNGYLVHNCQSFSFAGRRNGMSTETNEEVYTLDRYMELKRDGFQFVGESYLFWEYMRILGELRENNPDVFFFLENVEMGEKWENVLTKAIGIPGVHVNSALVSAQNRRRIYWTNIRTKNEGLLGFGWQVPDIPQPENKGIMLQDVLDDEVDRKYYLKDSVVDKLLANGVKGA